MNTPQTYGLEDPIVSLKLREAAHTRQKVTEHFTINRPSIHALLYVFLSSKKSFKASRPAGPCWFPMFFGVKHCLFKYSHRAFMIMPLGSWFWGGFPVWSFAFSVLRKRSPPCECFEIQSFTQKTIENQKETRPVWRRWMLFRGIIYVYTRTYRSSSKQVAAYAAWQNILPFPTGQCVKSSSQVPDLFAQLPDL